MRGRRMPLRRIPCPEDAEDMVERPAAMVILAAHALALYGFQNARADVRGARNGAYTGCGCDERACHGYGWPPERIAARV